MVCMSLIIVCLIFFPALSDRKQEKAYTLGFVEHFNR
jgi:hypothetical protein